MGEKIKSIELFNGAGGAITQNSYIDSDPIDLTEQDLDGFFSLYMKNTGGTVTVTVLVAPTLGGTYTAPDTSVAPFTAAAAGVHFAEFDPPLCQFMKLRFTETNVAAVTAMDARLVYK